jgi:hypothetical protein
MLKFHRAFTNDEGEMAQLDAITSSDLDRLLELTGWTPEDGSHFSIEEISHSEVRLYDYTVVLA